MVFVLMFVGWLLFFWREGRGRVVERLLIIVQPVEKVLTSELLEIFLERKLTCFWCSFVKRRSEWPGNKGDHAKIQNYMHGYPTLIENIIFYDRNL